MALAVLRWAAGRAWLALSLASAAPAMGANGHAGLVFDRLAPGFVAEARDAAGFPVGNGFAVPNRWGQYTAYRMLTDGAGHRTWRIEHNLPNPNNGRANGSTMYLLEGSRRALLIDTANPARAIDGVNDLKTVVRWLLSHDDHGRPKSHPLDFVVANTHNHGDHIGENRRMADRTVYYMDGDWPTLAPANYVPIREGGGPTAHGSGMAVGSIDLGGRVLRAIAVPPHTDGSTAYLDEAHQLLFSGDALGSGWPFVQRGALTRFRQTLQHVLDVTAGDPELVILPAHYFQLGALDRAAWPPARRVLTRQYVQDMLQLTDRLLDGSAIGAPFTSSPRDYWASSRLAKVVYSLDTLGQAGEALPSNYHAVIIPGGEPRPPPGQQPEQPLASLRDIAAPLYLIRGPRGDTLYLLRGSQRALLIGTGAGAPGLAPLIERLAAGRPVDVALLDDSASQAGGLPQLAPRTLYVAPGSTRQGVGVHPLSDGELIDLGTSPDGSPLRLEAQHLALPDRPSLSLLALHERVVFIGAGLGTLAPGAALTVDDPLHWQQALTDWSGRLHGPLAALYPSGSAAWYTSPAVIGQLEQALSRVLTGRGPGRLQDSGAGNSVRVVAELPVEAAQAVTVPRASLADVSASAASASSGSGLVLPLYPGPAPGTEQARQIERTTQHGIYHNRVIRNVTVPTLEVFLPEAARSNGIGVVIAPGGGLRSLVYDNEGVEVARRLVARGIAGLVLKYRVNATPADDAEAMRLIVHPPSMPTGAPLPGIEFAVADGVRALQLAREHARAWGLDPERIGFMGFSAGARVTLGVIAAGARPAFAAPIYGGGFGEPVALNAAAPPMFLAVASDDPLAYRTELELYQMLRTAGQHPELHVFERGGHGFGAAARKDTAGHWFDEFCWWLQSNGWLVQMPAATALGTDTGYSATPAVTIRVR